MIIKHHPDNITAEILYNSVAEGRRQWVRDLVGPDGVVVFTLEEALALEIKCPDPTPFPEMDFRFIAAGKGNNTVISTFVYEVKSEEGDRLVAVGLNCTIDGKYTNPDTPENSVPIWHVTQANGEKNSAHTGGLYSNVVFTADGEIERVVLKDARHSVEGHPERLLTGLGVISWWEPRTIPGSAPGETREINVLTYKGHEPFTYPDFPDEVCRSATHLTSDEYLMTLIQEGYTPVPIEGTDKITVVQ